MLRYMSLSLVASLTIANAVQAETITLFDNFGPGDTFNPSFSRDITSPPDNNFDRDAANAFQVPTTHENIQLQSIEVAFFNPSNNEGDSEVEISLHEASSGEPGTLLESFVFELNPSISSEKYLLASVIQPILNPGSQYWLVASAPGTNTEVGWHWNGLMAWGVPTGPVLVRANFLAWQDLTDYGQQAFRVIATGNPVPEPATIVLAGVALLVLVGMARRRK